MKKQSDSHWEAFWGNASGHWGKPSWGKKRILKILRPFLQPGQKILDAGCGRGFFSKAFLDLGCHVWSVDISHQALESTKALTQGRAMKYLRADLLSRGWMDRYEGFFDVIFSDGLLEHFRPISQERLLGNLAWMKRSQGILATFVPNLFSPWQLIRPLVMPGIPERPFTLWRLRRLHQHLRIIASGGINVLPFSLSPENLGGWFGMILFCIAC